MVTQEQLKKLAEPMDYKYRLQSVKYGKATIVSYVDSRQVQQKFDDVCGIENWQNEYRSIDGSLYGGISVLVAREDNIKGEWITKWDVGSESNIEKEKGNSSDSFKRSAVMWGVGRFLYSLGIITLKSKKHTNDKEYPTTDEGNILWGSDDLTEYCKKVVASGELDRTKPNVKPLDGAKVTTKPVDKVTPTTTGKSTGVVSGGIQPSTKFDDKKPLDADKTNALTALKKLEQPALLKFLIKEGYKVTSAEQFVENNTIELIREVYTKFTK